jgi:toxin YxiD
LKRQSSLKGLLIPFSIFVLALVCTSLAACGAGTTSTDSSAGSSTSGSATSQAPARSDPRGPRRNLEIDEQRGGHTLRKHVGRSDQELLARLEHENISASSTWTDRASAEEAIGETLEHNAKLERWRERIGRKPNLVLDYHGSPARPVGRCVARGSTAAVPAYDALVVLKAYGADDFYVLTAYPECSR